jgi:hypothetical protein
MSDTILVAAHVGGALVALAAGFAAIYVRTGGRAHKLAGKVYLFGWAALALAGALLGADDGGLSAFEVLNAISFGFALAALMAVALRRRIGPRWLRLHLDWMLSSLAGLWVATANQLLGRLAAMLELPYPFWFFVLLCLAPFLIMPRLGAFLARRHGLPDEPRRQRSGAAPAR